MSKLFAMKLKYFRELNGYTQSDLAKFAGTTRNMISNYEIGRSEIHEKSLRLHTEAAHQKEKPEGVPLG